MEPYVSIGVGLLAIIIFSALLRTYLSPWLRCWLNACPVKILDLVHIVTRGAKTGPVTDAYIVTMKAGMPISIPDLTALYVASPHTFIEEVQGLIGRFHSNAEKPSQASSPLSPKPRS